MGYVPLSRLVLGLLVAPDNLHLHNGLDLQGLLYIEYGFHVTLIFAAFVLAFSLLTLLRPEETGADPSGRRAARVR